MCADGGPSVWICVRDGTVFADAIMTAEFRTLQRSCCLDW